MTPEAFCADVRAELALHSADVSWARSARTLCEMYAQTDAVRFEAILTQLARGDENSALGAGGRWLLLRWRSANRQS
jgi:hypothetical protein